uniref:Uncharacterized protein n=1 Tax=Brassica oleracea var. oleracea TaxID=109376 RepID=A0A0D3CH73_BRAOL
MSNDTVYSPSINTVHSLSIDTVHHDTVHHNTVRPGTVHSDTFHPVKNDTTCMETEKIEVLILKVDENGILRDEECRTRNSAGQLINAQGAVIPDVIDVAEMNDFDLSRECWFSQLQPGSLTSWDDIERAFPYKFLDDAEATRGKEKNDKWGRFLASLDEEYMILIQLLDDIMAKRDEQHVSGELTRVEEAGTEDATSMSTDDTTSTSTDDTTSTSTDDTTSTLIDITTSTSIDVTTSIDDKKLDDDPHTSRGDLETSKASIGRHQLDEIDRQPPYIIDLHPPDIDRHHQPIIDRHHPPIDRCPLLDVLPCCIIEMEPIEERMYMSEASHLAVPKHQRPPFWTEEAVGFHKRVKRIHDPMKIVVPCAVFEAESPIPPDRSLQFSSYIGIDTNWIPSNDINKSASIDATTSPSIDTGRVSEQKEFDVCGNLRDRDTTTRSDKSGGKKRRIWKKRKRIMSDSQIRALVIAEMIYKGEESMEEAFTQE